jgi:hypothetical protein
MGHRLRRSRRPEELDRRRTDDAPAESGTADRVLALQRSAGNQAVSAFLARSPDAKPKEDEKTEAAGARVTLPDIGTIPLLSVSFNAGSPVTGGSGRRERDREKEKAGGEIAFTSRAGEHSSKLSRAMLAGKGMAVELIMPGGKGTLRLKLEGALVASSRTSGEGENAIESWTLNFESMEQHIETE